jgi:hypothetical protein
MIRLRHQEMQFHAHNNVERPQNRHLKPFKSRTELNGLLDPRINVRGRPKFFAETLAKELRRKVKVQIETDGGRKLTVRMTRAELIARAQVDNACTMKPHSVAAFRTIYEIVEPTEEEERGSSDREFTRLIAQLFMERKPPPETTANTSET